MLMGEAALSHHTLSKLCRHRTHSQIWPPHFCTAACAAPCAAPLPNRTLDSILRCCSLQHSTCAKLRSTLRAPCSLWTESWTTRCKAPHSTLHSVWPNFATAPWKDSTLPSASASLPNSAHNLGAPRARNLSYLLTLATAPWTAPRTAQHRPSTAPLTAPCTAPCKARG